MDKKALRRAYKETPRPMGVYRVRNVRTGRSLIGWSVDLPAILNRERAQLRLGVHSNATLQREWNELGADDFVFEVLDTLTAPETPGYDPKPDLLVLESMWLERLQPFDERGYNRRPLAAR